MAYFRFGQFPRPHWNYWNPTMMMPGGGPKPRPATPPAEEDIVPFIPPPLSESIKDEEEEYQPEQERRRHHPQEHHQEHPQEEDHEQRDEPWGNEERHDRERGAGSKHAEHDRERAARAKQEERVITNRLHRLKVYQFRRSKDSWKHLTTAGIRTNATMDDQDWRRLGRCSQVKIITWNVDMVTGNAEKRLTEALRYIKHVVLRCKPDTTEPEPCVIMLQEVRDGLLPFLLRNSWVRSWFSVTPFTKDKWPEGSYYGNVTLVSRSVPIAEAHILHYGLSKMQRSAVCVKIRLDVPDTRDRVVMAIVNTHLESMPWGAKARPVQLEMCARFLTLDGVAGGVVAGDMNAIGPEDATLPRAVGLKDSWRRGDDVEEGKTWGYQGQNEGNFPCARLDKILFLRGTASYKVDEPKRFGVGLKTGDDADAVWVSDHYGLETTLRVITTPTRMNSS